MRKSVARIGFAMLAVSALSLGSVTYATHADAQRGRGKPAAPAKPKPGNTAAPKADIELDEPAPPGKGSPKGVAAASDNSPPPQAGQMTEQAAQAKRLFDGEKW